MIVTNAVIFLICLHVTFPCKHGSGKSKALSELYKNVRPRQNYTNCCKQVAEKIAKDAMPGCEEQCLQCIIDRRKSLGTVYYRHLRALVQCIIDRSV